MRERTLMLSMIVPLLIFAFAIAPGSAQVGSLTVPDVVDTSKTPGSTVTITLTVDDVSAMLAFNLFIYYDTDVLTATNFGAVTTFPPSPFTDQLPSEINDTLGYVSLGFSYPLPEDYGLTTSVPRDIVWIDFTVDSYGASQLDIQASVISDVYGEPIAHYMNDGFFANIVFEQNANLVGRSAWPEHHHWVESKDPDLTLKGKVKNLGTAPTKVKVVFKVTYEDALWDYEFETTEEWIAPGLKKDLSVTITMADLEPFTTYGIYYVQAQCWFDSDGDGVIDTAGTKMKSTKFNLV